MVQEAKLPEECHEVFRRVVSASPSLAELLKPQTLREYFSPALAWTPEDRFPQTSEFKRRIVQKVARLYGPETADGIKAQLERHFIAETGTHLSLPREFDDETGSRLDNTLVWQGLAVSAALYRDAGLRYHLGLYSGNIKTSNTNGPRFMQLQPDGSMLTLKNRKLSEGPMAYTGPIDETRLNELEMAARTSLYDKRFEQVRWRMDDLMNGAAETPLLQSYAAFTKKPHTYTEKNILTVQMIENEMRRNGITLKDFDCDYTRMARVLSLFRSPGGCHGAPLTFPNQIAAVQTELLNNVLPDDIRQVTVDFSEIVREIMIDSLRDPDSLMHRIFSTPEKSETFIRSLANTRIGWTMTEDDLQSPFIALRPSKDGVTKLQPVSFFATKDLHTAENLANALEQKKIIPAGALEVAFTMAETGMMIHGGMFQCSYAPEIRNKLCRYLEENGERELAASLADMPLHIATQTPCFGVNESGGLLTFSDMMAQPLTREELDQIPRITCKHAFALAAAPLHDFLCPESPSSAPLGQQINRELRQSGLIVARLSGLRHGAAADSQSKHTMELTWT